MEEGEPDRREEGVQSEVAEVEVTEEEEDDFYKDIEKHPVEFLERIGEEQKFDVTFVEVEELSKKVSAFKYF